MSRNPDLTLFIHTRLNETYQFLGINVRFLDAVR